MTKKRNRIWIYMLKRDKKSIDGIFRLLAILLLFNMADTPILLAEEKEAAQPVLKSISFDTDTGTVSYELTMPSWVRIRAGIANGPLYQTLLDWEARPAGEHKETWSGLDPSGKFKLIGRKDLVFSFNYYTAGDEYLTNVQPYDLQPPAGNVSGRNLPNLMVNRLHKEHDHSLCRDAQVMITPAGDVPKTEDGFYIVKGRLPIEITISGVEKSLFTKERCTIHIFIDDIFAQGELDGYSPYTWVFDPGRLNEGRHLIAVNFAGYSDHYAMATLPVYVTKGGQYKYASSKN